MKLFENWTDNDTERFARNYLMSYDFNQLTQITDKWGFFRQLYMENIADIMSTSEKNIQSWTNAYYLDWYSHFSPIEKQAWNSIREMSGVVLYPQFPLFNFFIDFANPFLKIGLELDGKEHDVKKDYDRDKKLSRYGWKIFRVTGKEANADYISNIELDEQGIVGVQKIKAIEHWAFNTCDGVIAAIKYWYFLSAEQRRNNFQFYIDKDESDELIDFHSIAKRTLEMHSLTENL